MAVKMTAFGNHSLGLELVAGVHHRMCQMLKTQGGLLGDLPSSTLAGTHFMWDYGGRGLAPYV